MTGWRLPGGEEITPDRPWMHLKAQPGFWQRTQMVTGLMMLVTGLRADIATVTDLGCGDGSLLTLLPDWLRAWGYELGDGDVAHAREHDLDVRQADILTDPLEYGDLIVASEVLEHLDDPAAFLKGLPDRIVIASSPSAETLEWHNPIHSWAWDTDGYRDLFEKAGWQVLYQAECDGGPNTFGGVTGPTRFQAITAVR